MDEDGDQRPAGIGGWLTFFLVVIGIISPIRVAIEMFVLHNDAETAAAYGERWTSVLALSWVISAVQLGIFWFVAWRLLNVRNRQSVRLTIAGIWIVSLGGLTLSYLMIAVIAQIPLADMFAAGGIDLFQTMIFAIIWTAYFRVSKRVANTYRDREEMAEIFS